VDQVSAPAPQKAAELERPPLALIGAVVGDSDAIAVFLDRTNQKIVRLHQSETHAGWVLSSVLRREVTFKRDNRSEVLVPQCPDCPAGVAGAPAAAGLVPALAASTCRMHPLPPARRQRTANPTVCEAGSIEAAFPSPNPGCTQAAAIAVSPVLKKMLNEFAAREDGAGARPSKTLPSSVLQSEGE
jgi:hypothetical protein